jgi:two-component system sensor histidine kinase BarA
MTNKDIIDWDLAIERAGGKKELAKELFELLVKTLPQHQNELKVAFEDNDFDALHTAAHKLHSATCYCGTPRLKQAAKNLEELAKTTKTTEIKESYDKLCNEIIAVLKTKI